MRHAKRPGRWARIAGYLPGLFASVMVSRSHGERPSATSPGAGEVPRTDSAGTGLDATSGPPARPTRPRAIGMDADATYDFGPATRFYEWADPQRSGAPDATPDAPPISPLPLSERTDHEPVETTRNQVTAPIRIATRRVVTPEPELSVVADILHDTEMRIDAALNLPLPFAARVALADTYRAIGFSRMETALQAQQWRLEHPPATQQYTYVLYDPATRKASR